MNELNIESEIFMTENSGVTLGVYEDTSQPRGCPTVDEANNRTRGTEVRNSICDNLARAGMARRGNSEVNGTANRCNRKRMEE